MRTRSFGALELNPSSVKAHQLYTGYLTFAGRFDYAIAEIRKAQQLDPFLAQNGLDARADLCERPAVRSRLAAVPRGGRNRPKIQRRALLRWPCLLLQKQYAPALPEFEKARDLAEDPGQEMVAVAADYAASGNRATAIQNLGELKQCSEKGYVSPHDIAAIYSRLGKKTKPWIS